MIGKDASPREQLTHQAIDAMIRVGRRHHQLIEQRVESLGMHRSQHHMLMTLSRMGRTASQKDLAECLGISPAAVTRTLKTLEADGWVEKAGGTDSRRNEISLRQEGREKVDATRCLFRALDQDIFADISDAEIAAMTDTLNRMLANIARMESEDLNKKERETQP